MKKGKPPIKKDKIPLWSKEAQKKMIDLNMSKTELAEILKVNYAQLCNVLSGYVYNDTIENSVCQYFKIER